MSSMPSSLFEPFADLTIFGLAPEVAEQMRKTQQAIREMLAEFQAQMAPFQDVLREIGKQSGKIASIEAAGWLPHNSTPFDLVALTQTPHDVDRVLTDFYRDRWDEIEDALRVRVRNLAVDDETKATFGEALVAHRLGLFRVNARLLFPEIERSVRTELSWGLTTPITSQKELREAVAHLDPMQMRTPGWYGLRLYRKLTDHLYGHLKTPADLAAAKLDPVPNRHATVHGLISYSDARSSMNMLIMADFVFTAISAIKVARSSGPA